MSERPGLSSRKLRATRVTGSLANQQQPADYSSYASIADPKSRNPEGFMKSQYTSDTQNTRETNLGDNIPGNGIRQPGLRQPDARFNTVNMGSAIPSGVNFQPVPNNFHPQVTPPMYLNSNMNNIQRERHLEPHNAPNFLANQQPPPDGRSFVNNLGGLSQSVLTNQITNIATEELQNNLTKKLHEYTKIFNLKYYFDITTASVCKKIIVFIFPFFRKNWGRVYNRSYSTGQVVPLPPSADINAPDLYIPVMTIITYIIMSGIAIKYTLLNSQGAKDESHFVKMFTNTNIWSEFSPELLVTAGTKVLSISILETLLVKLALYVASFSVGTPWLDVYAICGYKYLSSIILYLFKLLHNSGPVYYIIFAYVELCSIVFTMRTLKMYFIPQTQNFAYDANYQKTIVTLLCIVTIQAALSWWLTIY